MVSEDLHQRDDVRQPDGDLAVETSGPPNGRVDAVREIGRSDDDYACPVIVTSKLLQQTIYNLSFLPSNLLRIYLPI